MIDGDGPKAPALAQDTIKHMTHRLSRHAKSRLSRRTPATPAIDDREDPNWSPVGQGIMDDIHAPRAIGPVGIGAGLRGKARGFRRRTRRRSVIHLTETTDGRGCDSPTRPLAAALPDPLIAEPRSGMGQIPTTLIPRGSMDRRQPTGPQATDLNRRVNPGGPCSSAGGPQTVFRSAADSIGLSSERSATSRFNQLVASSPCRRRRSSLTPRGADGVFQA